MLKGISAVIVKFDKTNEIMKSLQELKNKDILIGVPASTTSRKNGKINNAELTYIHTNGSPLHNIPARPIIEPAIEKNSDKLAGQLSKAAEIALDGKSPEAELIKVGIMGQNIVRDYFTDPNNGWAPNAPSTIARKGSDKPLIDKAELRKSMTYVIREKR
jgi:hypothetical protein